MSDNNSTHLQSSINQVREDAASDPRTSHGKNEPTPDRALLVEMTENFHPFYGTLEAAETALITTVSSLNQAENNIRANKRASVRLVLADIAFHAASGGLIVLDANAEASFGRWLKAQDKFLVTEQGNRTVGKNEAGDDETLAIDTATLLDSVTPIDRRIALLYAIGHKSGVTIGCMPRTKTKRVGFTSGDTWEPLGERKRASIESSHYVAVTAPEWAIWPQRFVTVTEPNKPKALKFIGENKSPDLVYLRDDWASAMYQHHFAGRDYTYDDKGENPRGFITGVASVTPARGTSGDNNATDTGKTSLETVIAKHKDHELAFMQLVASTVTHKPMPAWAATIGTSSPQEFATWLCAAFRGLMENLRASGDYKSKTFADSRLAAECCLARSLLTDCFSDERKDGDFYTTDEEGKDLHRVTAEPLEIPLLAADLRPAGWDVVRAHADGLITLQEANDKLALLGAEPIASTGDKTLDKE